jgi:hypothetical protein
MTEGLMEHPATHIDSRIDNDEDIAICWDNGTTGRVAGSNIILQVYNGDNVFFHSAGESLEGSSDSSSSIASEQAPAPRVARAPDVIDSANELALAPRVTRAPDVVDLTLDETTDENSDAKNPPDDISTSAAEDAVCYTKNTKKKPVALDDGLDEDIAPKPASKSGSDLVDSVMGDNLSNPVNFDGYAAAESDSVMSYEFEVVFGNTLHGFLHNQARTRDDSDYDFFQNQPRVYDASDEYSESTVTSMEFARESAAIDNEVAGLRALLTALKKRVNESK